MFKKCILGCFVILISLISACSSIEPQINLVPEKLEIITKINTDYVPKKCVYSSINKTLFVWEAQTDLIHIYNNGERVNTIGGMGFDSSKFNKLSDITISPDGNLLALDSFNKKIKKFDENGKFITEVKLAEFVEPSLFAVAIDETYYIYDNALKEVIITRTLAKDDWFTFGKFQFNSPAELSLGKNNITIYDAKLNSTLVFETLGRFQEEYDGKIKIANRQIYKLEDHFIYHSKTNSKFAISINKWLGFNVSDNVVVFSANEILIGKFKYSRLNEN